MVAKASLSLSQDFSHFVMLCRLLMVINIYFTVVQLSFCNPQMKHTVVNPIHLIVVEPTSSTNVRETPNFTEGYPQDSLKELGLV